MIETNCVRNDSEPSCDALTRVTELNSLVNDSNVDAIWLAAGGDFQFETLPYLDFDLIEKNPKWYLGASDPTNLLFPITCKCDLATVYGFNAGSFDEFGINEYSDLCIEFLKGKITLFIQVHYIRMLIFIMMVHPSLIQRQSM